MDILWSESTTMRNPRRAYSFLDVAAELDGRPWTEDTQEEYQCLLIQRRAYTPTGSGLSAAQIRILRDDTYEMDYAEARAIFDSKGYEDPPMRGRTSLNPLAKLGLVALEFDEHRIRITPLGWAFLRREVELKEIASAYLLKYQLPNPLSQDGWNYDTKPFINTLRLIQRVNELCWEQGRGETGISADEFGIFALSIRCSQEVDQRRAKDLLKYRDALRAIPGVNAKETYRTNFVEGYLSGFQSPAKNTREYADNMIRYLEMDDYVRVSAGRGHIDLEPDRLAEIDALLAHDDGSARKDLIHDRDKYIAYLSDLNAYTPPFGP